MHELEEEIIREAIEDERPEPNPWPKRIFVIIMTILSVGLIASFAYIQFPIASIIPGQVHSEPVQGDTLTIGEYQILFSPQALESVIASYADLEREAILCLEGTSQEREYTISNAYEPEVFSASYTHVTHAPCNDETIALFHTHPYKSCTASEQDLQTLEQNQHEQPETIMIIMCEENRFRLYD